MADHQGELGEIDVNAVSTGGETALIKAASYGHDEFCIFLMDRLKANPKIRGNNGWTAEQYAERQFGHLGLHTKIKEYTANYDVEMQNL
eukprot:CAMPEP_0170499930 /NCGR_PEP_ID=MMETSP0208-20121228/33125_1 /TAXON_ID=197538 /ORGANISM="Strombidium inclinatum, Strain S3" /LENGTH=88 /DNA_ID=CAMNT_0010777723 /DNA_START=270 /DNA_END=533 /DNA_ORIENTATION=+